MGINLSKRLPAIAAGAALSILAGSAMTLAANITRDTSRQAFDTAISGKKVAWVPLWMGVLESEWTGIMKDQFGQYGISLVTRDPNFNNDAQLQAVSQLIDEKPDVLIVQNNSTTLLAKELKRASDAGIYVVQMNMASNYVGDAYVGVDYTQAGHQVADELIKQCGGGKTSGEVALILGEATAAPSIEGLKAITDGLKKDPTVKIVSSQPGDWDANKANQIATTVLQQYPKLCAIHGFWGPMAAGAAQAVKNAGRQGDVKVFAISDGQMGDCDLVEQGLFTKALSNRADVQGITLVNAVLSLLQGKDKPGDKHLFYFTNNYWIESAKDRGYCYKVDKAK
ncbi:sugar ABC transporter substrate-binding protein [Mesorhizobium sp.]|uniref:sugar ABC transporter substrate-binding protein n=1 Tax=Mesorhizobium sp. TaxID=1871066 RepID=UPI000FE35991|nr:sugar ABC transporter substrate-binding protein [Mesorhizobium sp.]RWH72922.1 MAG: sugar ABC transporter substrate-binding protein [Mesorhizobium sp.]RWL34192.1 MAG: sugar ABC transporter substrate-binding protein [Mesorhizobium sp.]RWL35608.1 MAG: sugar ABC transporter substrate-binding protein [Mesorhizobium sp.]RWL41018.1 MAG: sugar ABC transporter substrate-binding protein [Mesorhizobium sp.]RWL52216.1 MAG: sugar ABC transporter substrate-binding protein [Mesorhizobium sp.]